MELNIVRRFRGNVHGSIDVSEIEDQVIAHPAFQRLRRIKQTAFLSLVFPGASHTRFEHSLGVMHQTSVAWQKLRSNQRRLRSYCEQYPDFMAREMSTEGSHGVLFPAFELTERVFDCSVTFQALRLAALLHDVGHPPFSHSGERFLPSLQEVLVANRDGMSAFLGEYFEQQLCARPSQKATHEIMTMVVVDQVLNELNAGLDRPMVQSRDVISILCPTIEPNTDSPLRIGGAYVFCHELVSGDIDVDRMDYLRRDSKECGVVYGIFDCDRIMDSLVLYWDPLGEQLHLAIQFSGLAAFEDYLRARQSMYLQLYFHKTSVAAEAMLQAIGRMDPKLSLPSLISDYLGLDDGTANSYILNHVRDHCPERTRKKIESILHDLLSDRKLWKRIYEITFHDGRSSCPEVEIAKHILEDSGIAFEQISSSVTLTNFKKQGLGSNRNFLKLVKKDGKQFPRVLPIEDYSRLIQDESTVEIRRIYLDLSESQDPAATVARAKGLLNEAFFSPH